MPGPLLTAPGFWGKLPATGDFVGRRLPAAFVREWDPWVSRHLIPRLAALDTLCFHVRPAASAAMSGVVLASADRSGRPFTLTLATPLEGPADPAWYAALADLGRAARAGLDAVTLDARLLALPPPVAAATADPLTLWLPGTPPQPADPEAPGRALDTLLGPPVEVR